MPGFQLDTLTTCKQYGAPTVEGRDVVTTRTDYVNKYPSMLQTTSYNFTATQTTQEACVGVVKAPSSIHPKNPCQHAANLAMLVGKVFNLERDTQRLLTVYVWMRPVMRGLLVKKSNSTGQNDMFS